MLVAGLFVAGLVWDGPVLVTDWMVRAKAVPIQGSQVDGSCNEHLLLSTCRATLTAPGANGATVTRFVEYAFTSIDTSSRSAQVVADPQRPEWLTTDLGLDRFWNRVATFLVSAALLGAIAVNQGRSVLRGLRNRRSA